MRDSVVFFTAGVSKGQAPQKNGTFPFSSTKRSRFAERLAAPRFPVI